MAESREQQVAEAADRLKQARQAQMESATRHAHLVQDAQDELRRIARS